jgi:hypothetical protein
MTLDHGTKRDSGDMRAGSSLISREDSAELHRGHWVQMHCLTPLGPGLAEKSHQGDDPSSIGTVILVY